MRVGGVGGGGNEQVPFQLAEMKGKERIFMFTANIALNTKKETENTKRNKKKDFLRIPKTCQDQRQKNIYRTSREEKQCGVLKATTVVTFKLSRQVGLGPAVACPANSAGICRFAPPQAEHPGESTNATDCQSSSTHTQTLCQSSDLQSWCSGNKTTFNFWFHQHSHDVDLFPIRWSDRKPARIWCLSRKNWCPLLQKPWLDQPVVHVRRPKYS